MKLTATMWRIFVENIAHMIEEQKDYLCELDRKLGDGDHGVTMSIGWQEVNDRLKTGIPEENDISNLCITTGKTFLSAVGSSVGPLYASGFLRGAKVLKNKSQIDDQELVDFWIAFIEGIKERGKAEVGDKTMIDALQPAMDTLNKEFANTGDFLISFTAAVKAAKLGMESTKDMLSKRGRSSRLGERSLGTQDPGATSAYLILEAFLKTVKASQISS